MKELKPKASAQFAKDVYALTDFDTLEESLNFLTSRYGQVFEYDSNDLLKGDTGGLGPLKCKTAFGFTLIGKGALTGNAFIIFRGTHYIADWLTDGNVGISSSTTGKSVHDGFNKSFKSMEPQLIKFMDKVSGHNIRAVHCIGHSLGGALATICGEWIKSVYQRKSFIYTFGSPRVGLHGFSGSCTSAVGEKNIFRVYHKTDIVPCVPTWPFFHVPLTGKDYFLYSPGIIPLGEYHKMKTYVKSVSEFSGWAGLTYQPQVAKDEESIKRWLTEDGPGGVTISALDWLESAIQFVLEKAFKGALLVLSNSFSTTFTLLDKIAYMLHKGIEVVGDVSMWVVYLIRKILKIIGGNTKVEKEDLTIGFLRYVFQRLMHRVNQYVKDAMNNMLVEGRAI